MIDLLILVILEIHLDKFGFRLTVIEQFIHRYGMFVVEHLVGECPIGDCVYVGMCVKNC